MAFDAPDLVHSLALLEPPLRMVPSGEASTKQLVMPAVNVYRSGDKRTAIETFPGRIFGPDWQPVVERTVPGGVEQAVRDADAFFLELAALQAWSFGPEQASAIGQPVLSVVGSRSAQYTREVRELLHTWLPQTEDFSPPTTHLLQMQDPEGVAHGLSEFFLRHPLA